MTAKQRVLALKFLDKQKRNPNFAKKIGVKNIVTHVGFIPEVPTDPEFEGVVGAVREVCEYCKNNGQYFRSENLI